MKSDDYYDVFQPWKTSRLKWGLQTIRCWLGTAHSWKTDMDFYDGDWDAVRAVRQSGNKITYVCRFCGKRKKFW